ncbi:MAG: hypothetical protein LBK76_03370 [Verrucomicrobiales bacterium]|nr:hypothetical protein [Verrucomicrobiales bacterium]
MQRTHFIQDVELTAIYPPPALVVKVNDLSNISGSGFPNKKSGDIAVSAFFVERKRLFLFLYSLFLGGCLFHRLFDGFFHRFFRGLLFSYCHAESPPLILGCKNFGFFPRGMSYAIKINYGNRQYYFASRRDIFFLDFFDISNFVKYE